MWRTSALVCVALVGCARTPRATVALVTHQPRAQVQLQTPRGRLVSPPPVLVRIDADARTYWDNHGVITQALGLLVARLDAPGIWLFPRREPGLIETPPPPLPERPSDAELAKREDRIREELTFDLAQAGVTSPGLYRFIAGFGDAWAGPETMEIAGPQGPANADALPMAARAPVPVPASRSLALVPRPRAGSWAIEGAFRAPATDAPLTIVALALRPTGGVGVLQRRVAARASGNERTGSFAVPATEFDLPATGRFALFAFLGELQAGPLVVDVR